MARENIYNRMKKILKQVKTNGHPGFSVVKQYPGESYEEAQRRADQQKKQNIRQFGQPGLIVIIKNFCGMEVKNDTKQ